MKAKTNRGDNPLTVVAASAVETEGVKVTMLPEDGWEQYSDSPGSMCQLAIGMTDYKTNPEGLVQVYATEQTFWPPYSRLYNFHLGMARTSVRTKAERQWQREQRTM